MNNQIEVATRAGGHFYFYCSIDIEVATLGYPLATRTPPPKTKKAIEKSTALVGLPGFELQQWETIAK